MSIAESMELQRQAVAREREAAARRARQLELETERKNVGNKLKQTMKNNPAMSDFMYELFILYLASNDLINSISHICWVGSTKIRTTKK